MMATSTMTVAAGVLGELPLAVAAAGTSQERPTYVYDLAALRARCAEIGGLPIARKSVFFATMANDHPRVIDCVRACGHGVFVNSPRHLAVALGCGFSSDRIVYASSNMVEAEMRLCASHGLRVVLDSIEQLRAYGRVAPAGSAVGLRVSVGFADGASLRRDPGYRFGVLPEELGPAVEAARSSGLRVAGLHSYLGTDLVAAPLVEGVGRLVDTAARVEGIEFVDAGGGFCADGPGDVRFDLDAYAAGVSAHLRRLEAAVGRGVEFVVEPGRYLAASCGHFFVRVVDVKERADRVFVGTDASTANFPRPLIYPERGVHPCGLLGRDAEEPPDPRPVYVCGNSTYSQDFLARAARLPLPRAGDVLVFGNAGAYCRSMMTRFLGKDRPAEVVLDREPAPGG